MENKLAVPLSWLVTFLIPIALVGFSLRVLLTPAFLVFEYNMPYFPVDEYGFTKTDRLKWAPYALDYLVNEAGIDFLGDLHFEDGTPLFNDRELKHMQDVKQVTRAALGFWTAALAALAALGIWAWRGGWDQAFLLGARRGGWLIVALAGVIGLVVLVGVTIAPDLFWGFFTAFHNLFFEGDSWIFLYSDTLIRLFPIRFWQDAFLLSAVISLGGGLALALGWKR
jgi:integral membrane protein (TIGR01906 family)